MNVPDDIEDRERAQRAVERQHALIARDAERTHVLPRDVDPYEALQRELKRSEDAAAYLESICRAKGTDPPAQWVQLWQEERARVVKTAGTILQHRQRAEELKTAITTKDVDTIEKAVSTFLVELGFDAGDAATRGLFATHLWRAMGRQRPIPDDGPTSDYMMFNTEFADGRPPTAIDF